MSAGHSAELVREFVLSVSNTWHIAAAASSDCSHVETACHRLVKPREWAEGLYVPAVFPSHYGARGGQTRSVCSECGFYRLGQQIALIDGKDAR